MIEHAFTVRTDSFEATTPGPTFINPRCFGEDFATWLRQRLQASGVSPSEPIAEDWGWVLVVPYDGRRYTLSIGIMEDSIGRTLAEWRVGVAFEKPMNSMRSWFAPPPAKDLKALADVLERVLRSEPRFHNVTPWQRLLTSACTNRGVAVGFLGLGTTCLGGWSTFDLAAPRR